MSGASSGSGTAAGRTSPPSNAPPLATGYRRPGSSRRSAPADEEWAERIGNRNVRAAFLEESIDGYTAAHDLRVWTGVEHERGPSRASTSRRGSASHVAPASSSSSSRRSSRHPGQSPHAGGHRRDGRVGGHHRARPERRGAPRRPQTRRCASSASWTPSWSRRPRRRPAAAPGWTSFEDPGGAPAAARANPNPNASIGGDRATYVRLARKQLVGVYVTVWGDGGYGVARARDVRAATVSTGVNLGVSVLGNKGGAAVLMKLYATPVCFICSHLSAGSKEGDEAGAAGTMADSRPAHVRPALERRRLRRKRSPRAAAVDAFAAVWIGDLNYRLNLPDDVVRAAIAAGVSRAWLSDQ